MLGGGGWLINHKTTGLPHIFHETYPMANNWYVRGRRVDQP